MSNRISKWQGIDNQIKESFEAKANGVSVSDDLKWEIDSSIRREALKEEKRLRKWSIKKKVIVAMAVAILGSTACLAGGQVTAIISGGHPDWLCYQYNELDKAEEKLGFEVQAVETFTNGYAFKNLDVQVNREVDDNNNTVGEFKSADISYVKDNLPRVSLDIEKTRAYGVERTPNETEEYGEITLSYYLTHYKFVPVDYELTEEDKKNLEREDYEISVGSDEIEYNEIHSVHWEMGDLSYGLMVFDTDMSTEELFQMAEEVIEAK